MKDSTKSKIAWGVSFLFSGIGTPYIPKIKLSKIGANANLQFLFSPRFSIIDVVIFFAVLFLLYFVIYFVFINHHKTKEERLEEEFRQFKRMPFYNGEIIAEWNPVIQLNYNKGIADDFQLYCYLHPTPQRMNAGICHIDGCKYHTKRFDVYDAKVKVESAMDQTIRRLKEKYKIC